MSTVNRMPTEILLRDWRYGPIDAERMCAGVLSLESYESIDPQAPLGGPDGTKDVICVKDSKRYIAAVYFPSTDVSFNAIESKFVHDLTGIAKNSCAGMVFFVNKHISIGERATLESLAQQEGCTAVIYHLERIRALLDVPMGYSLRQQYLRIQMTQEEMTSAMEIWNANFKDALKSNANVEHMIDKMYQTQSMLLELLSLNYNHPKDRSQLQQTVKESASSELPITSHLSLRLLFFIHKIAMDHPLIPAELKGNFRTVQTWIAEPGEPITRAIYVPPLPEEIEDDVMELLTFWNKNFSTVFNSSKINKLKSIVAFHIRFISIHPFIDGNGRVARILLNQQIEDLLGIETHITFKEDSTNYYMALQAGQKKDLRPMCTLLTKEISK